MSPNRMKSLLLSGKPAFGVSIMIPSPQIVEMVGRLGFDWILIDLEHGAISLETAEELVRAAESVGLTPIARPRENTAADILQLMDRGVVGVQVPHVNTAEDARRAVAAVKYHPLGTRGLGGGTRAADYGYGEAADQYVETANRETLVCVQIEEEEGVRNADAICQVEGVDVVFVGPSDLSQSMGFPGNPGVPEVQQAIDATFERIRSAGKVPGTPSTTANVSKILDKGILYTYTHVTGMLKAGAEGYFGRAK
jgi:2-keto-3-deoxy-L-rhamnonate aldolase RhmA